MVSYREEQIDIVVLEREVRIGAVHAQDPKRTVVVAEGYIEA